MRMNVWRSRMRNEYFYYGWMWTSIWGWMCEDLGWGMNTSIKDECELVYEDECVEI